MCHVPETKHGECTYDIHMNFTTPKNVGSWEKYTIIIAQWSARYGFGYVGPREESRDSGFMQRDH